MKLNAEINDEQYTIELNRDGSSVFAEINGRQYDLEASEPEPNVFLLKHGGKIHQIFVPPQTNLSKPLQVMLGGREIGVTITDPKRLRGSGTGGEHAGGPAEIKTAMPGKVVRILVSVGDPVQKGDGVIVVEAMKMQNEMKAPKDGTVGQIKVAAGDIVSSGDVLVVIE